MIKNSHAPFSLYVHIPFCASRCGYCDFNTYTAQELGGGVSQASFHELLICELVLASSELGAPTVSSVFVGGGTPTLIGSHALTQILVGVKEHFPMAEDVEITTEANPDSVDARMLAELREEDSTEFHLACKVWPRACLPLCNGLILRVPARRRRNSRAKLDLIT